MVLPLVPVTPARTSRSAGLPASCAARSASARRGSATRIQGAATPSGAGRSLTTATAPRETASAACARPSNFSPRIATKRSPGWTRRESLSTRVTLRSCAGCGHLGARQGGGELHEPHGAEGGGAVSSKRRQSGGGRRPALVEKQSVHRAGANGRSGRRILGDDEAGALDPGEHAQAREEGEGLARGESARARRRFGGVLGADRRAAARRDRHDAGRIADGLLARRGLREHGGRDLLVARRHAEDPQRLGHDAREQRRRDVGRVVLSLRFLEDDHRHDARPLRRSEAREVGDVASGLVSADAGLLRRARLAGDREAGDRRLDAGAVVDDADENAGDRLGGRLGQRPASAPATRRAGSRRPARRSS